MNTWKGSDGGLQQNKHREAVLCKIIYVVNCGGFLLWAFSGEKYSTTTGTSNARFLLRNIGLAKSVQ